MPRTPRRRWLALAFALGLGLGLGRVQRAEADSFVSLPELDYASDAKQKQAHPFPSRPIKHLIYPVLGFPSLVEPGGRIPMKVYLPGSGTTRDWVVELVTSASPTPQRVKLAVGGQAYDAQAGVYTVELTVPPGTASATYDIELDSRSLTRTAPGQRDVQPNAVRVVRAGKRDYEWIHLSDTQIQDIRMTLPVNRASEFLEEIRRRDPDFCVYSGDFCFGMDYSKEYEESRDWLVKSGVAMFMVPGNHDGYAGVELNHQVRRDGLCSWRRYMGPLAYSFDVGSLHFVGVNSMGGPPERRNSIGIVVANFGGQVDAADLAWIEADVKDATARGKSVQLFMHHDPTATPDGNSRSFPVVVPRFSWQVWNDPTSAHELGRIIGQYNITHVWVGHTHTDGYSELNVGSGASARVVSIVTTTTLDVSGGGHLGYRVVHMRNGAIDSFDYAGKTQQSVPFPAIGLNVELGYSGPRDGSLAKLQASVASRLLDDTSVRLELPVAAAPGRGLRASGPAGTSLEHVGVGVNGAWVASVRAPVAALTSFTLAVEPDPTGAGVFPAAAVAPASTASTTSGSGGVTTPGATGSSSSSGAPVFFSRGGSGCVIGAAGEGAVALAPLVLLAFGVAAARRSRRASH